MDGEFVFLHLFVNGLSNPALENHSFTTMRQRIIGRIMRTSLGDQGFIATLFDKSFFFAFFVLSEDPDEEQDAAVERRLESTSSHN
ncbi:MAG: hypothetical protein Q8P67_16340 [archaeon]|nr:hypothetical protein [archaeon]